jgi:hypothetical protein
VLGACDRVLGLTKQPPPPDAAVGYVGAVLADMPLAYWRLGSPGAANDESGNGNTGMLMGNVATGEPGALLTDADTAMRFDGVDDTVNFGDRLAFLGSAPFTIEMWVKPKSHAVNYGGVLSKTDEDPGGSNKVGYMIYDHPTSFGVERHEAGNSQAARTGPLPLDVWAYVVATYDGTTLALYVDGTLKTSDMTRVSIPPTTKPLVLGARNGGLFLRYAGALDEVALYDHALSLERIDAHRRAALEQ